MGTPGPDSGFALRLAQRFEHELKLGEGESEHDVLLGVALIAVEAGRAVRAGPLRLRRALRARTSGASSTTRRPTSQAARRAAFSSISHDYVAQRALVDSIPEETLRLTPEDAAAGGGSAA